MHPTVLYCSPMKERDETLRGETGRRVGNQRLRGKQRIVFAMPMSVSYSFCCAS